MTQTLRDFIGQREAEIKSQLADLQRELRELNAARRAIEGSGPSIRSGQASGRLTIKDMIKDVLDKRPNGGLADQIIEWIKEAFAADVPRTSMSPQLSRLKSEGAVVLNPSTNVWQLAKHASTRQFGLLSNENEPAEDSSDEDAEGAQTPSASELQPSPTGA